MLTSVQCQSQAFACVREPTRGMWDRKFRPIGSIQKAHHHRLIGAAVSTDRPSLMATSRVHRNGARFRRVVRRHHPQTIRGGSRRAEASGLSRIDLAMGGRRRSRVRPGTGSRLQLTSNTQSQYRGDEDEKEHGGQDGDRASSGI